MILIKYFFSKVIFEVILGTSVVNAWIVYNMLAPTKLGIAEFRKQLAELLMKPQPETPELIVRPGTPKKRPHTFTKPEGPGRKKRKVCRGCYKQLRETGSTSREADKKVRRVISFCHDCPGQPGYCLTCFNNDHN